MIRSVTGKGKGAGDGVKTGWTCAGGKIERFTCTDSIIKISRYPRSSLSAPRRTFTPTRAAPLSVRPPPLRPGITVTLLSTFDVSREFLRYLTRKLFKSHSLTSRPPLPSPATVAFLATPVRPLVHYPTRKNPRSVNARGELNLNHDCHEKPRIYHIV